MKKLLVLTLFTIIFLSCSILEELGIPDFISEFKLNVLNDVFTAADIAEDNENLISDNDTLRFVKEFHQGKELGTIEITDTEEKETNMTLSEIGPSSINLLHGQTVVVDTFTLVPTIKVFDDFSEFQVITFASGLFNIFITNNTAIWCGNAQDNRPLLVDVINTDTDEVLQTVVYDDPGSPNLGDIPPAGGTSIKSFQLAGKTYPTSIKLKIYGGSRGTDGVPSLIDTTETVNFIATITNAEADYVMGASIEQQEIDPMTEVEEFDIPMPLIEGEFQLSGLSSITFDFSPIKIPTWFDVSVTGFNEIGDSIMLERFDGDPVIMELPINEENTHIIYTSNEYNINEIISIIPEIFNITLFPTVGDGTLIEVLSSSDSLNADVSLVADFQIETFGSEGIWIVPKEEGEIKVTHINVEEFDNEIYDMFQSGTILFKYLNPTGMKMAVDLVLSDSISYVREQVQIFGSVLDTNKVQLFQIPLMDTTSTEYLDFEIDLTQEDLDYFLADSVFWVPRFNVISNGLQPWVGGVGLKAELQLKVKIGNNLID